MRYLLPKPSEVSSAGCVDSSSQVDCEKKKTLSLIHDDISGALLDVSFQRMLKKEKVPSGMALSLGPLELWSDEYENEGKGNFAQYRSKLVRSLIKCIGVLHFQKNINATLLSFPAVRIDQAYCFS